MTLLATKHHPVIPRSRASTRGRYSRIVGVIEALIKYDMLKELTLDKEVNVMVYVFRHPS